jgi:galacturonosyltransferase
MKMYEKYIIQIKPDVVLTYAIKPNIYAGIACQRHQIPYIVNITGLGMAVEYESILQKITLFLYRKSLKKAQMVFFQNSENQEFMVKHNILGKDNYSLLPGSGVNLEQYVEMPYPEEGNVNFVFVARVIKEKGINQYLDAAKYYKNNPSVVFHVCGDLDGNYDKEIEQLNKEGVIVYHGDVEGPGEINKIYAMSNCIIHPTYYPEGISNVLLEAAASGRPIIATNRSGCREVVNEGINGFLIPQKDSQSLIRAIEKFLELSYQSKVAMGIAGRKKVEKEFDRNIVVSMYLEQIRRACHV